MSSSSIKVKTRKSFQGNASTTLDKSHNKKVQEFETRRNALPKKKAQLLRLEKKLKEYNKNFSNLKKKDDSDDELPKNDNILNEKATVLFEIEKLKDEISDIENNVTEMEYYWKASEHLIKYYKLVNVNDEIVETNNSVKKKNSGPKETNALLKLNEIRQKNLPKKPSTRKIKIKNSLSKNIIGFFNKKENPVESSDEDTSDDESEKPIKTVSTDNEIKDRARLNDEYHQLTDPKYRSKYKPITNVKIHCNKEMKLKNSDGMYVCQKCGIIKQVIVDSDKPSHKEHTPEPAGYPYKRINHFNEHLAQIQAKETTDIPNNVYTDIKEEMKRRRKKPENLKYDLLRNILKKLGYSRYYEHIPYMIFKINGKSPPVMTREMEDELKRLFKLTLKPFEKYKPADRTNYLKYSYALYKLCQLLEYDEFLPCCSLFKSKEKLRQQDTLWKKICDDLNWEFYPSEL
jgi:hypothetical protein